jgi:hypothetical protein
MLQQIFHFGAMWSQVAQFLESSEGSTSCPEWKPAMLGHGNDLYRLLVKNVVFRWCFILDSLDQLCRRKILCPSIHRLDPTTPNASRSPFWKAESWNNSWLSRWFFHLVVALQLVPTLCSSKLIVWPYWLAIIFSLLQLLYIMVLFISGWRNQKA